MLLRFALALALSLCALAQAPRPARRPAPARPKLLLAIVVDQFRYDYLHRFAASYNSGLARLTRDGAVFTNAHYEHFPTVTAIGHSTILTGATPSISGIVGNEWFDRESGTQITSVSDKSLKLLGAPGTASSPHRLLVSTVADEIKMAGLESRSIGISIKDRSAILPIGRMGDGAYWFDNKTGNFVSSSYYFPEMPGWASEFNTSRSVDKFLGKSWGPIDNPAAAPFLKMAATPNESYYASMQRSPFGNDLLEMFAESAIVAEKLGQHAGTDVLAVSFSSNDYVGHEFGPDDPRVRDISIRTDRVLGKLFDFLEAKVGMRNVLVFLTADHGVAPLPELMAKRHMPGGRITEQAILDKVQSRLTEKYGEGKWIVGKSGPSPYLNHGLIASRKLDPAEVRRTAAAVIQAEPHIARVYTRDQLAAGALLDDGIDRRVKAGFHFERGSDLFIVAEPYYLFEKSGTSHGTPYNYDTHVPIILMGPSIRPGQYSRRAAVNDIAPTLATLLNVSMPSGSVGRVLEEALMGQH